MRLLALFFLSLCLALPASAERKQSFGSLDVHYSVFNASFLQPQIAAANGLVRGPKQGVVNIALLDAGKAREASVTGTVRNLLGQSRTLEFKQVREGAAIYYLAQFRFDSREVLQFDLRVQTAGGPEHRLTFNQEMFPEE